MKIAIIGYSGSGKSTLANFLGQHYNCEVLHLD
ncbi:MAG: DNA topology modulation protein FlaR, partial [Streptococcus salivarius]